MRVRENILSVEGDGDGRADEDEPPVLRAVPLPPQPNEIQTRGGDEHRREDELEREKE